MTTFSISDYQFMARALKLARRGLNTAHPNPRVGCVLSRDGEIAGEGWHRATGEPHAEIIALNAAGDRAAGATAYVTLEPCAHHGRTGPCSRALIDAGVQRVVVATRDPFPDVAGRGIDELRSAGIQVDVGLLETDARKLNEGFLLRVETGKPLVRLKLAASIDGATAMASGESQWITGDAARRDVQRLRARSGAILTGIGTVLADDPSLTVREPGLVDRQPLRVVVDSQLQTPPGARLLAQEGNTLIICANDAGKAALEAAGADVLMLDAVDGRVALDAVLMALAARDINEVLIEAGAALAGAFIEAELIDELVIYQAPHMMGSETQRLARTPGWQTLADRLTLQITDRRQIGADIRITARPVSSQAAG